MYAMVNKGGGKYYTSTVFAFYDDEKAEMASCWGRYYIVLNEEKNSIGKAICL